MTIEIQFEQHFKKTYGISTAFPYKSKQVMKSILDETLKSFDPISQDCFTEYASISISIPFSRDDCQNLFPINLEKNIDVNRAASLSAIICGVINILKINQSYKIAEISQKDAINAALKESICSASDSFLKIMGKETYKMLISRFGTEEKFLEWFAGRAMRSQITIDQSGYVIGCGLLLLRDIFGLSLGKLTTPEILIRNKFIFQNDAYFLGSIIGNNCAQTIPNLFLKSGDRPDLGRSVGAHFGSLLAGFAFAIAQKFNMISPYSNMVKKINLLSTTLKKLDNANLKVFHSRLNITEDIRNNYKLINRHNVLRDDFGYGFKFNKK
jgi:hypothetical protein